MHGLAVYNSTAHEMYNNCDGAVKKKMEKTAQLENVHITIGSTETNIRSGAREVGQY
jgi:archaellum component FlaF (FlaF/FlaG flagellin family)